MCRTIFQNSVQVLNLLWEVDRCGLLYLFYMTHTTCRHVIMSGCVAYAKLSGTTTGGVGTPPPDVGTGAYIEKKASFLVEYIQLPEYMYSTVRLGLNLMIVYTIIVIIC